MRNFRTLLIATTAIAALSSCSKDNNTPQPAKPNSDKRKSLLLNYKEMEKSPYSSKTM